VVAFCKVTRDLTAQKMADLKLATYMAELEIQNGELEQFAYVASHDLQEPLRKIQTFTELIQENLEDPVFVKNYFEKLDASAKRMAELVRSLLNYSRLSKDKEQEVFEDVDLNNVLQEVQGDFELMVKEKHATIKSSSLPTIRGNKMQILQLFSNLMSNSLKFSKTEPVISISSRTINRKDIEDIPKHALSSNFHKISFADNGIGFEMQYNKIIFSLFQRLHGKQYYAGTGIGLALCKKIAENHGGFMTASSEEGKGAVFSIFLPAEGRFGTGKSFV
jgi:signal transduction histidine kinase